MAELMNKNGRAKQKDDTGGYINGTKYSVNHLKLASIGAQGTLMDKAASGNPMLATGFGGGRF
jgi:hypothetical protein